MFDHIFKSSNFVWTDQDSSKGQQYTVTALYCTTLQNPTHTEDDSEWVGSEVSGWVGDEWVSEWSEWVSEWVNEWEDCIKFGRLSMIHL